MHSNAQNETPPQHVPLSSTHPITHISPHLFKPHTTAPHPSHPRQTKNLVTQSLSLSFRATTHSRRSSPASSRRRRPKLRPTPIPADDLPAPSYPTSGLPSGDSGDASTPPSSPADLLFSGNLNPKCRRTFSPKLSGDSAGEPPSPNSGFLNHHLPNPIFSLSGDLYLQPFISGEISAAGHLHLRPPNSGPHLAAASATHRRHITRHRRRFPAYLTPSPLPGVPAAVASASRVDTLQEHSG